MKRTENGIIAVIGLGYVGLQVAVAFSKHFQVIGYDIDPLRISELQSGKDRNGELRKKDICQRGLFFTHDETSLHEAHTFIITVPTPVDEYHVPDLSILINATSMVGKYIKPGSLIIYESTVYPGATEELCVPELERSSGLRWQQDFHVGYSPERINPGDRSRTIQTIAKIVASDSPVTTERIRDLYSSVLNSDIHVAPSIKVAEAAKVFENTQRDVNIALMNELSIICNRMNIDTGAVLEAAGTKWNFLRFYPGLVGGHCIGVDPYYLTYKAQMEGYHPEVILAGRRINDNMGIYVASSIVKKMIERGVSLNQATVTVLGLTFKENIRDIRNSKSVDLIRELESFGITVYVSDQNASKEEAYSVYGVTLTKFEELPASDAVIICVSHDEYRNGGWRLVRELLHDGQGIVGDIRHVLDPEEKPEQVSLWRL